MPEDTPPPQGSIRKAPTGIPGFDEVSEGGLPRGRATLVIGGPGAGKTVFGLETLVNGARRDREPGIFVAFEENSRQIVANASTFGWDVEALEREHLFFLDAHLPSATIHEGDFDLSAMLAGLGAKAEQMGARRLVLDGIDVLLSRLDNPVAERREIYRIYEWLQQRDLTVIITAKADESDRPSTERYAFLQFMVDCVVVLQTRLVDRIALRTTRILKYRGSGFSEGEFPVVIGSEGMEVSTFGSPTLDHPASTERTSTGVPRLDTMLGGGYYRGSATLISGAPGTSKTTLAGAFVLETCMRGERALFVSFDEGKEQIIRNLRSVSIDLEPFVESGQLDIYTVRTEARGAEEHLVRLNRRLDEMQPDVLVIDPISALSKTGGHVAASHASLRLIDAAKARGITIVCTSLVSGDALDESTTTQISTIADTWMHLAYVIHGGERNRTLTVIKSRGTRHSNQVRELLLSDNGVTLADVYTVGGEVLVGTARWEREQQELEAERRREVESERKRVELQMAEAETRSRIASLERELAAQRAELELSGDTEVGRVGRRESGLADLRRLRHADSNGGALHDENRPGLSGKRADA